MKIRYYVYTMLYSFCILGIIPTFAKEINVQAHYYTDFSSKEDFEHWKVIDLNGQIQGNNFFRWDEESKSVFYAPGVQKDGDDWLFSPGINLTSGKNYLLKINMFCDRDCEVSFSLGTEASVGTQTISLSATTVYNGDYYLCFKVPKAIQDQVYYIGIHNTTKKWKGIMYLKSVELVEDNDAKLSIQLNNNKTKERVVDASLELEGDFFRSFYRKSQEGGICVYDYLTPGAYRLSVEKEGFEAKEMTITLAPKESKSIVIELNEVPQSKISGIVVDEDKKPIEGASVTVKGMRVFEQTTNNKGEFTFDKVPSNSEYSISVVASTKLSFNKRFIPSTEHVNLGTIVLHDLIAEPAFVKAEKVERGAFLSWIIPKEEKYFVIDNDNPLGTYQLNSKGYTLLGNRFSSPMVINDIEWATPSEYPTVDIYIFSLDQSGEIDEKPILVKNNVPCNKYDFPKKQGWSNYSLEKPIATPYGCVIAIGHQGTLNIISDYSNNWASVVKHTEIPSWRTCETGCFLIRASGLLLTSNYSETSNIKQFPRLRSTSTYQKRIASNDNNLFFKIWRLKRDEQDKPDSWVLLADNVKDLVYLDKGFVDLPKGFYRYAVQTLYPNGKKSEKIFSNELENMMYTNVTINVYTNTAVNLADGAVAQLIPLEKNGLQYQKVVSENKAVFKNVQKGDYKIVVSKDGFNNAVFDLASFNTKKEYVETIDLSLNPLPPFNIRVSQIDNEQSCIVSWNNSLTIYEDFEKMPSFEVNPKGTIGWTYYDGDKATTFGIEQCKQNPYPNMYAIMAYQVFAPYETNPSMVEYIRPHSGKKVLVSVSPETGVKRDDYLFSPELNFNHDFVFSFWACAGFFGVFGEEDFMVGYSLSKTSPEDVTWITPKPISVNGLWKNFSFKIPKTAKHVIIRAVSGERFFFLLDDISIGIPEADIFQMSAFNIEIDGKLIGSTTDKTFQIKDLDKGKHIVKIQTVYTMADMTKSYSPFSEITFNIKDVNASQQLENKQFSFNRTTKELCPLNNTKLISLYDLSGVQVSSTDNNGNISTDNCSPGTYILMYDYNGRKISVKIIL